MSINNPSPAPGTKLRRGLRPPGPLQRYRTFLAQDISQLCDISEEKANEVVGVILEAMKEALWKGEDVNIPGFGILRWQTWKARTYHTYSFPRFQVPQRQRVAFFPAESILRTLNPDHNYDH